ncbi:MAG: NAD(+)/NADH kinase [Clostridia bacterium]|nr:NAD(+)/NADH kinase [Clostridia bacterium]MDE7328686.1 NAD(+)/NADH kinase [Clostridia bacterium]
MKIGVKTNLNRDLNASTAHAFCAKLKSNGLSYKVCDNASDYFDASEVAPTSYVYEWCDVVVSFGGDGTMLDSVRYLRNNQPILGINMGKIGFLTEVDENEIDYAVKCLKDKSYEIETRTLIKISVDGREYHALNEIIVSRQDPCHISSFDIELDGVKADTVRSDGILVSTPTGSTAYSLSCNGPVLSPSVKALIVNAICPHSLHSCPMVIDDNMKIKISTSSPNIRIIVDGIVVKNSEGNGLSVTIEKADKHASFIRFKNENFYNKLRKKLNYWGE